MFLPNNAKELADKSEVIVHGICESREATTIKDPKWGGDRPVDHYKLKVLEVLKGAVASPVFEWSQPSPKQSQYTPPGLTVGKEYLLFFTKESASGIRLMTGSLGEGAFSVSADAKGAKTVVNPFGNRGLVETSSGKSSVLKGAQDSSEGTLSYDKLKQLIQ